MIQLLDPFSSETPLPLYAPPPPSWPPSHPRLPVYTSGSWRTEHFMTPRDHYNVLQIQDFYFGDFSYDQTSELYNYKCYKKLQKLKKEPTLIRKNNLLTKHEYFMWITSTFQLQPFLVYNFENLVTFCKVRHIVIRMPSLLKFPNNTLPSFWIIFQSRICPLHFRPNWIAELGYIRRKSPTPRCKDQCLV